MLFADLKLKKTILDAVAEAGYEAPTPIQREAIPHVLVGRDLVAIAQTGTGKTAAFALPLLHRLHETPRTHGGIRTLVLAPTRELASQICDGFRTYGKGTGLVAEVIFGGVGQDAQTKALRRGMDILVATPGRLLDLMSQRLVNFQHLEALVLDEADRMLDMGFIHDVKKVIAALPSRRQTLLFSATMPADIVDLAKKILVDPVRVEVTPPSTTVEKIAQSVFFVEQKQKRALLLHLLKSHNVQRALVFTRTKHFANRVAEAIDGAVGAAAIHGNKSQNARERALQAFKDGTIRVLVATDIAARGIDIDGITHVIQLDLPEVPEQYVHRIGRTARAGASGVAWAFCSPDDRPLLRDIEKNIRMKIDVAEHSFTGPATDGGFDESRRPQSRHDGQRSGHGQGQGRGPNQGRGGRGRGRPGRGGPSSTTASASGGSSSAAPRSATMSFRPGRR